MSLTKRFILLSIASVMVLSALASMGCGSKKTSKRGIIAANDSKATPDGAGGELGNEGADANGKLAVGEEQTAAEEQMKSIGDAFSLVESDSKAIAMSDLKKGTFTLVGITAVFSYNAESEKLKALNTSLFKADLGADKKYENIHFEDAAADSKAVAGTMTNGADEGLRIDMPLKFVVQEDGKFAASRASADSLNILVESKFAGSDKGIVTNFIGATDEAKVPKASILDLLAKGTVGTDGRITVEDGNKTIALALTRDATRENAIRALIYVDEKNEEGVIEISRQISVEFQDLEKNTADSGAQVTGTAGDTAAQTGNGEIAADEFKKAE